MSWQLYENLYWSAKPHFTCRNWTNTHIWKWSFEDQLVPYNMRLLACIHILKLKLLGMLSQCSKTEGVLPGKHAVFPISVCQAERVIYCAWYILKFGRYRIPWESRCYVKHEEGKWLWCNFFYWRKCYEIALKICSTYVLYNQLLSDANSHIGTYYQHQKP